MPSARFLLGAAIAAAVAACTPRVPPPDLALEPAPLLAQVQAAASVTHAQGDARLRVDAPGAKGVVTAWVAVERPDRLHVEALDFFGNPAATLVAADGRLAIYDARAGTFYTGAATAANVARLVPLPLEPERLVALLCGTPLLVGAPVSAEPGRGFVALQLEDGPRTTSLRVGPRASVLRATFRGGAPGVPDHEVRYGGFLDLERGRFPTEAVVSSSDPAVRVELGWKEPDLVTRPDPALFRMEPPSGARRVDLDATPEPPLPVPLQPLPPEAGRGGRPSGRHPPVPGPPSPRGAGLERGAGRPRAYGVTFRRSRRRTWKPLS
jgi:hypothetical protein